MAVKIFYEFSKNNYEKSENFYEFFLF